MAIFETNAPTTNASDAEFRKWGKAISDGFAAAGWVKHGTDIDWATVATPTGAGAKGYEIWRMNDALQATAPVFLKIEYGEGTTTDRPQIWLTLGNGADGGGNITLANAQTPVRHVLTAAAGFTVSAAETPMWISGSTSRIGVALWVTAAAASTGTFFVERSKNNAGANTNEYFTLYFSSTVSPTNAGNQYTLLTDGRSAGVVSRFMGVMTTLASSIYNNAKGVGDIKPYLGKYGNPATVVVAIKAADWSNGATADISVYGTNVTYRVVNTGISSTAGGASWVRKIMMRWE